MNCPDAELLSAVLDGEASEAETRSLDRHLGGCAACRSLAAELRGLKAALEAQPVPPMPGDLRASLERMAAEVSRPRAPARAWLRAGLWRPALALSLACAALLLAVIRRPGPEIPLDLVLAAHEQYERRLPLAPTEQILAGLPGRLARAEAGGEE